MGKLGLRILTLLVCGAVLVKTGFVYYSASQARASAKLAKELKVCLLYELDHKTFLAACRKVLEEAEQGTWEKGYSYAIRRNPHPAAKMLPEEILLTNPASLVIRPDNTLMIEYMGGFVHFGINAYPEHFVVPFSGFDFGDKMLVEGLWYYDDGYYSVKGYDTTIEALRQEAHLRPDKKQE